MIVIKDNKPRNLLDECQKQAEAIRVKPGFVDYFHSNYEINDRKLAVCILWLIEYLKMKEKQQSESPFIKVDIKVEDLIEANIVDVIKKNIEKEIHNLKYSAFQQFTSTQIISKFETMLDFIKANEKCSIEYVNKLREDNRKYYHIIQYIKQLLKEKTQTPNDSFDKILNFIQKEETNENI